MNDESHDVRRNRIYEIKLTFRMTMNIYPLCVFLVNNNIPHLRSQSTINNDDDLRPFSFLSQFSWWWFMANLGGFTTKLPLSSGSLCFVKTNELYNDDDKTSVCLCICLDDHISFKTKRLCVFCWVWNQIGLRPKLTDVYDNWKIIRPSRLVTKNDRCLWV